MKANLINILLIAGAMTGATEASALPLSHFSTQSRLNSGKWVRIKVSQTGMQSITFDQLREWGFQDPSKVAVFGFGNIELNSTNSLSDDLPDDLSQTAMLTGNDRIIFYGEATHRLNPMSYNSLEYIHNIYDNYGYYFLSDCESPKPLTYKNYYPAYNTSIQRTNHYFAQIIQPDDHNHMSGGAYWLGPELSSESTVEYTFPVKGYQEGSGLVQYGTMGYTFVAANENDTTSVNVIQPANVTVPYVNNRYTSRTGSQTTYFNSSNGTARFRAGSSDLQDASITYGFRLHPKTKAPRFAAMKSAWVIYPRRNDMYGESQMAMTFTSTSAKQNFKIASPGKVEVWNIGDPLNIYAYQTAYSKSEGATIGSFDKQYSIGLSSGRLIAFDPAADLHTPEFDGVVPNQNIHGDETPDMVIITTEELYDAACELADIHRSHGSKINVYTHQQVLNEFGSGGATPMAYRLMAKMFYDRNPQQFRSLLLYGPTTWDFRSMYMPESENLLTFLADKEAHYKEMSANFSNDSYFGMLEDNYDATAIERQTLNVAVGRLNVPNNGTGHDINIKIRDYMDNPLDPAIYARMLVITGNGDANAHFYQGQTVADNTVASNPAFTPTRAHISLYPISNKKADFTTKKAIAALYDGQGFFDYSGHGDENNLGSGDAIVWQKATSSSLTNSKLPITMLSTCSAYNLDHGNNDIATSLTFKAGAGAIATIGACRKVYLAYNGIFNSAIAESYAESKPGSTIGDMFIQARHAAITNCSNNQDALANTMCYNLCGDPLTTIPVPDYTAAISTIDGKTPSADNKVAVAPGNLFTVSGSIVDAQGNTVNAFNGSIRAIVYDGPSDIKQYITAGCDTVRTIQLEEDILAEIGGRVEAGKFSIDMCLPQPRIAGLRNRIILSALSDDNGKKTGALGYTNDFLIDLNAEETNPQQGKTPVISSMYINTPEFRNGSELTTDITNTFYAIVDVFGTGISNSTAMIGATPRLTLDGKRDLSGIGSSFSVNEKGQYVFSLPLNSEFTAGYHNLKFSLSNTLGESASRSISFLVVPVNYNVDIKTAETTATESVTIEIDSDTNQGSNRLLISDALGNTVFSAADVNFPYKWNLKDSQGLDVADGVYHATVMVADAKGHGASQPARIVVVRN
ncbi:MAG: hypothetical protein K2I56_06665 [Muribaculaceae bacterium]|nr:hypothetical protein [Muribaculaceae bacterium]